MEDPPDDESFDDDEKHTDTAHDSPSVESVTSELSEPQKRTILTELDLELPNACSHKCV